MAYSLNHISQSAFRVVTGSPLPYTHCCYESQKLYKSTFQFNGGLREKLSFRSFLWLCSYW